jgi:protein-disulfide isomerase
MQNKNLVVISLFIVIALFGCLIYFYKSMQKDTVALPLDMAPSLVRDYSVSFGENRKNIIVVEFLDPECESCALFHPMVKKVFKEYHTDIKLVIKYLPNHKNSKFVTKILEASREQHKYNEVLSMIFEKQPLWAAHNNEKPELLWTFLTQIEGLDIDKLKEDMNNPKIEQIIDTDTKDAKMMSVRGTPTIFVNDKKLEVLSQKDLFDLVENEIYK